MLTKLNPPISDIENFCTECSQLGYENNGSLKAMKYEWCLKNGGAWWAVYKNNKIISMAGAHPFEDGFRFLFRGAQIEHTRGGLSKKHMTSSPWEYILPEQIAWASGVATEETPAYITTNIEHDASGKMNRIHRVLQLLERQGIVSYMCDKEIYYTLQSVWKLNVGAYYETLV